MWIDDRIVTKCSDQLATEFSIPERPVIVLGRSNQISEEICQEYVQSQNVAVLRRYGGGGTVVLHPGCVIISLGCWVKDHFNNSFYFRILNQAINTLLGAEFGEKEKFSSRGISDLCWENRKFGGTSMFRSRNYLLYQASILVDAKIDLIESCLLHPPKEPDYRVNRSHRQFLVGLNEVFCGLLPDQVLSLFQSKLGDKFHHALIDELVYPDAADIRRLDQKVARSD